MFPRGLAYPLYCDWGDSHIVSPSSVWWSQLTNTTEREHIPGHQRKREGPLATLTLSLLKHRDIAWSFWRWNLRSDSSQLKGVKFISFFVWSWISHRIGPFYRRGGWFLFFSSFLIFCPIPQLYISQKFFFTGGVGSLKIYTIDMGLFSFKSLNHVQIFFHIFSQFLFIFSFWNLSIFGFRNFSFNHLLLIKYPSEYFLKSM